jgi:hypothetical protein
MKIPISLEKDFKKRFPIKVMYLKQLIIVFSLSFPSVIFSQNSGISFVTEFYRSYLDAYPKSVVNSDSFLIAHPFFSKSVNALLDSNIKVCSEKAGTDICGYGADCDIFLNAQETGPNLTFKTSRITAHEISSGLIEISYTVYPNGEKKYYEHTRRLKLVQDDGQWRVDDIFEQDTSGKFPIESSMRYMIRQEIDYYLRQDIQNK